MTTKKNALSGNEGTDMTVSAFNVPAIEVAKQRATADEPHVLSTGVRCRILPVSGSLIDEVTTRLKDPTIPIWHNPDKDTDEENPSDPSYLAALAKVQHDRTMAAIDAMILFGVELVDGLPEDKLWLKKLKFLGIQVDEADPFSVKFAYLKYVAVGASDLPAILSRTGIAPQDVEAAVSTFRGSA